ncbi:MAG TPA: universal stress protein [Gammaproteobacteria bacterium]|nr:universal stress protein [Gammaproteobacteria bacterium]
MKLQRIMVATKPWERGLPIAANHARQLAQSADAEIEIVGSVYDAAVSAGRARGDAAAHRMQDRTVAAARVALERLAASMRDWRARVTTRIVWGVPPYEAILAAAEDWRADLLVVGTHERGTLHTRLTDTDWQLMRRAGCPLLLVKGAVFSGYRTILAAVDSLQHRDGPHGLDRAVLAASRCVADVFGSTVRELASVEGSAAQAIIDAAHRCADLVVVGVVQRRRSEAAVIGNTAELVAGELPCDVLIVPTPVEQPVVPGVRSQVG